MAKFKEATWRGPVPNRTTSAMVRPIMGLVCHIQQGHEAGTDACFHNPKFQASAHFGVPLQGPLDEWVDTDDKAWAEVDGNSRWISAEFEGFSGKAPAPTANQVSRAAHLLAWLHTTEGVPLRVTNSVNRRGLGWHGMGGASWGSHFDCPGDRIKNARRQIIKQAKVIVANTKAQGFSAARRAVIQSCTKFLAKRGAGSNPLTPEAAALTQALIKAARAAEAVK